MGAVLGFAIGVVGRVWKAFVNFLIFVRREKRRETVAERLQACI